MQIVHISGMKRPRKLDAQILFRCSSAEKADYEVALELLRLDDPEMDFSKWARRVLDRQIKQLAKKHPDTFADARSKRKVHKDAAPNTARLVPNDGGGADSLPTAAETAEGSATRKSKS